MGLKNAKQAQRQNGSDVERADGGGSATVRTSRDSNNDAKKQYTDSSEWVHLRRGLIE
jgi:hypothetical protein